MKEIKIDGELYKTDKKYLLDALNEFGFDIPKLCHHPDLEPNASCRLCLVKVDDKVVTSCNQKIKDGMNVVTNTKSLSDKRKTNLELILANHDMRCDMCFMNGNCELQSLSEKFDIEKLPEILDKGKKKDSYEDNSSNAIHIDSKQCILCGRCVEICKNQDADVLNYTKRGYKTQISTAFNLPLADTGCISCGQCVLHCPTSALLEKNDISDVLTLINDPNYYVVAQVAPSIRVSLGELFGIKGNVKSKIPSSLKLLGFDSVLDTSFGADMTIMEEAMELIDRIKSDEDNMPMFTSCCPAWVNYIEFNHKNLIKNLSSTKSPQIILGHLIKKIYSEKLDLDIDKIKVVSIMPCTAKKVEASRVELRNDYVPVDYSLTTKETAKLLKQIGINLADQKDSEFDEFFKTSSSAGEIFGTSGGVTEAALRTAYYFLTDKNPKKLEINEVRGLDNIKVYESKILNTKIKIGVVNGVGNFNKILNNLHEFDFIEVMACPGGCIGGGGQPQPHSLQKVKERKEGLYDIDDSSSLRLCHENPIIKEVYKKYYGEPLSESAESELHTRFLPKSKFTE